MARHALRDYSAKRRFTATPEPAATLHKADAGPLLFVVQQHSATRLHFDFRLECDGVLKSWAVPKGPSMDPADKRLAVPTEDHPFDYASFEGVIPEGQYGAGEVIVWDCGIWSPDEGGMLCFDDRGEAEARAREGLGKGKLGFTLCGEKLKGSFALVRTSDRKSWLLIKHRDRFAGTVDLAALDRSPLTNATVEEIAAVPIERLPAARLIPSGKPAPMPAKIEPMHAEPGESAFNAPGWMWEPKMDGYRVLAFVRNGRVTLRSRRGLDLSPAFPALLEELAGQPADMVLDGELIAFDAAGQPSFNALQNRVQLKAARDIAEADRKSPVAYVCFDLLHFAGIDLRAAPYADRSRYLAQCLLPSAHVQRVHASEDGLALQQAATANGFEGVVGKRRDSRYEAGRRSKAWLKVKGTQSGEFLIGGYTRGNGSREALGALLLGYREGGKLHYASNVGTGFDARTLDDLRKRLAPLERKTSPFAEKPPVSNPTVWVQPKLIAEVKYHQWTEEGSLRAPVFLRLRDDLDPAKLHDRPAEARRERARSRAGEVVPKAQRNGLGDVLAQLEAPGKTLTLEIGDARVRATHLDRVYWPADTALKQPALTKRDLLRYFASVSEVILPHLADRPLTMIRMPDGIGGQRFFQKHWEQAKPDFVETITVWSESRSESHEYLLCNNLPTLLWLAQSGTLEFHVWHSRARPGPDATGADEDYASSAEAIDASVLNRPDWVVFDIDPYIYSGKESPGGEPELNTTAFEKGKEVAFRLKDLLAEMSLAPIVKTSGKTGLHVFVPIRRTIDFDTARGISEQVGRHLMRLMPKDVTLEWSIPKRTGKIFMDYNMNVRGKTLNVAYSPRGLAGAPVSMPLTWKELEKAHPLDFRITNAAARLAKQGDRWRDALEDKQDLGRALGATPAANAGAKPRKTRRNQ